MPRKKLKGKVKRTYSFNWSELRIFIRRCNNEGITISDRLNYLIRRDNWEAGEHK